VSLQQQSLAVVNAHQKEKTKARNGSWQGRKINKLTDIII
jgi:hypothetical protein